MNKETLQTLIDGQPSPEAMTAIARAYLDGSVLRDPVAAEAWLMRAIAAEDPAVSARAMGMLAALLPGSPPPLTDRDYLDIRDRAKTARGQERTALLELLKLATPEQKNLE